jgi:hypothetical protein
MSTLAIRRSEPIWAPLLAASLALVAAAAAVRGIDLPAALYRVELFHRAGLTLWDNQWYGGHWTLNYSTLFPPTAGLLGIGPTKVLSATLAAWAFDRLVIDHFGRPARLGSLVFAFGTLAQVALAQLPFLLGEALALTALALATRERRLAAIPLGFAASLASPLAGGFLALAAATWVVSGWPARRYAALALAGAALLPVAVSAALFPGQGPEAFPALDFGWLLGLVGVTGLLCVPARERGLRIGLGLYLLTIVVSFAIPNPIGGNIARLAECVGAPLAVCLLWPRRRQLARWKPALGGAAIGVLLLMSLQWGAAIPSLFGAADQSRNLTYFQPLLAFLARHDRSGNRVEVVPTKWHWEAAYVAPQFPLARGWERQLDTADNPLFYDAGDPLTPTTYRAWLAANGVRYVALPDVALDFAGVREGALVRAGVPGLRLVWRAAHWRVYEVLGAPAIVSGPARLSALDAGNVVLQARHAGQIVVRVRDGSDWEVASGPACVTGAPGGWIGLRAFAAGPVTLHVDLDPLPAAPASC